MTGMAAGGEVSGDKRGGMPAKLTRRKRDGVHLEWFPVLHIRSSRDTNDMQLGRKKTKSMTNSTKNHQLKTKIQR